MKVLRDNCQYILFVVILLCIVFTIFPLNFSTISNNVFSQFPITLWLLLVSLSAACIICLKFKNTRKTRFMIAFSIFFVLYIMLPLSNFPIGWKCTEEQAYFANAFSLGLESRDIAWFGSQMVQLIASNVFNFDLITTNFLLAASLNFALFLLFFVLGEKLVGERYGYLVPVIFALSETYEYNYFATQSLGLLIGLLIIWFICTRFYRQSSLGNGEKFLFVALILALSISHSLTALLLAAFLGIYLILAFKFTRNRGRYLWIGAIAFLILVFYNIYNFNSLMIVGQHLSSLLDAQRIGSAVSPSAYLGIPYYKDWSYAIIYFSRYIFLGIVGLLSVLGFLKMYFNRKSNTFLVLFAFCLAIGLLWFVLKMSVFEDYGNRFMMFGLIALSIFSAFALSKVKLLRFFEYFFVGFIIFSFAICFFPVPYLKVEQQWQFNVADFYTTHSDGRNTLVTETFMGNFVYFSNASTKINLYLTQMTVYGLNANNITLPRGIILRSISQEAQTYLKFNINWPAFDSTLNSNCSLCYDDGFSKLYLKID